MDGARASFRFYPYESRVGRHVECAEGHKWLCVEHFAEQILVVVAIIQLMNTGEDEGSSLRGLSDT